MSEPQSAPYSPPRAVVLGTLAQLTQQQDGNSGDCDQVLQSCSSDSSVRALS
jgi:hypothetical protein